MYPRYRESIVSIQAPASAVFAFADDHSNLASHMSESSWMMGGGSMRAESDSKGFKTVGSELRMSGRVMGVDLQLTEVVTERIEPIRKVWKTTTEPHLLVIGRYQMGFEILSQNSVSKLKVFIHYALPERGLSRWLGELFSGVYARWCTRRMSHDIKSHFDAPIPK